MPERCEVCGLLPARPFPKDLELVRKKSIVFVEVPEVYDGALYRLCLWCASRMHRFEPDDPRYPLAKPYVDGER